MEQWASVELLSAAEWFALIRDVGFVKECGVRNVYLIFALSRMAVVHESSNSSGQLTQLTFEGFCEVRFARPASVSSSRLKHSLCPPDR